MSFIPNNKRAKRVSETIVSLTGTDCRQMTPDVLSKDWK
jgi:hypothetical protein